MHQVGAIVLELTKQKEIGDALLHLTENLTSVRSSLCKESNDLEVMELGTARAGAGEVIVRSLAQLETCVSEVCAISQLLNADPLSATVQPPRRSPVAAAPAVDEGHRQSFATLHALEGELESISPLSAREREVLALLAKGKTNKEIARLLTISSRTVESHRARIMLKLDLDSLSDLVRYAVRTDLIRL